MDSRKLAENLLRTFVTAHLDHTRVAIITYAKDVTTVIDFISANATEGNGTKMELFSGESPLWDLVVYDDNETLNMGTYTKEALQAAREIMEEGRKNRPRNITQTVFLVSDGSIPDTADAYPYPTAKQMYDDDGIHIFTASTGQWEVESTVQIVSSKRDFFAASNEWHKMILAHNTKLDIQGM